MTKRFTQIIAITLIILIGLSFVVPAGYAYAGNQASGLSADSATGPLKEGNSFLGIPSFSDLVNLGIASVANIALASAAWLVGLAGQILNVSIVMTLRIKDFVDTTPAIYTVWKILRDITGLFFIFFLLFAAIQMILGRGSSNYSKTIVNIVVAGILINFSFFFTSILIDASNVVSQAIYNAMIPNQATVTISRDTNIKQLVENASKGQISDVFMNSLKIQTLYDSQGNKLGAAVGSPFKIILIGLAGVIMMLTTAASFILAALAFIARLAILLFLLAFSPLWFAGSVIPQIQTYTKKFLDILQSQLLFMPIYLLLMYVALRILNDSNLIGAANVSNISLGNGADWTSSLIILAVNFTLVIVMLNLPLVVGMAYGGVATEWLSKSTSKWNAYKVWGNVGGWAKNRVAGVSSQGGSRTLGRAAFAVNESSTMKKFNAASPLFGGLASSGLSKVGKAGFGVKKGSYKDRLEAASKAYEAQHKQIGSVDKSKYILADGSLDKESFDAANKEASDLQKKFRENLPWRDSRGKPGGVLGFLLDNRASRQSASKLESAAKKEANKRGKKGNIARVKAIDSELAALEGSSDEERKRRLQTERQELQDKIDEAIEAENEERDKKIIDKIESSGKKDDSDDKPKGDKK